MKRLCRSACRIGCLQCCPESCFAVKSLSRNGTMLPACGTVLDAGLCWPKRSIPDCIGHRTGVCIHLRRSDVTFQLRRIVTSLYKSWRLIRYIVLVGLSVRESVVWTLVHPVTTILSTMSAMSTMMYALRCQAVTLATSDVSAHYHSSRWASTSDGAHLTSGA